MTALDSEIRTIVGGVANILPICTSFTTAERQRILRNLPAYLRGDQVVNGAKPSAGIDPIRKKKETAEIFGVSRRTLENWARKKLLNPVRLPGCKRLVGYRDSEIRRLIAGENG